jgi:hypothetical protein
MKVDKVIKYHKRKLDFQKQKLTDLEFFYTSTNYNMLGINEKASVEEAMDKCRSEIKYLRLTIDYLKGVKQ